MKDDTFCSETFRPFASKTPGGAAERAKKFGYCGLTFLFFLFFLFPAQELQAQCESSPPECQPNMELGHGPDPCMAKIYCSNSGAVESGLIACTNAADTDGCGIEAFSEDIGFYEGQYDN